MLDLTKLIPDSDETLAERAEVLRFITSDIFVTWILDCRDAMQDEFMSIDPSLGDSQVAQRLREVRIQVDVLSELHEDILSLRSEDAEITLPI